MEAMNANNPNDGAGRSAVELLTQAANPTGSNVTLLGISPKVLVTVHTDGDCNLCREFAQHIMRGMAHRSISSDTPDEIINAVGVAQAAQEAETLHQQNAKLLETIQQL